MKANSHSLHPAVALPGRSLIRVSPTMRLAAALVLATIFLPLTVAAQTTHTIYFSSRSTIEYPGPDFGPRNLAIEPGDTIEWINKGFLEHSIVADQGEFPSFPAPMGTTFSHTFNEIGITRYHCGIHGKRGIIAVVPEITDFKINNGLNDAWFDPDTEGQGFFITVYPQNWVFLSWFTWDLERPVNAVTAQLGDPGHRWLTAAGGLKQDTAILDVELTKGGVFNANLPQPSQSLYGTIVLQFHGCNNAVLWYEIPSLSLSGTLQIERTHASPDKVALCEEMQNP